MSFRLNLRFKDVSRASKILFPFLVLDILFLATFILLIFLRDGQSMISKSDVTLILVTLFFILSIGTSVIVWIFDRRLGKVTRRAEATAEGRAIETLTEPIGEEFQELVDSIDRISVTLKRQIDHANERKNHILAILDGMVEGVMVIDKEQRIVRANSVLCRMLKLEGRGQIEGKHYWEVVRDSVLNEMIQLSLRDREPIRKEHSLVLSGLIFEIQISPVFGNEVFLGAAVVFYDVTKLKELERMRAEFVANVSHELKTPLTSILGFIETLREGAIEDKQNRMKFLLVIEDHARRLNQMIDDLLTLSKLDQHKDFMKITELNFDNLLEKVLTLFERTMKERRISLIIDIKATPFMIRADSKFFEQVLVNLIDNAVKYNVDGGQVIVRASFEDKFAKIEVCDTGIGIAGEDLPRIFERFYRADKSRSRETGGTGLGLAIVKHITECHLGRIEVQSALQKGSTFTIFLPRIS